MVISINLLVKMVCYVGILADKWNIHYWQWKHFSVQKYALYRTIFLACLNSGLTEEVEIIFVF